MVRPFPTNVRIACHCNQEQSINGQKKLQDNGIDELEIDGPAARLTRRRGKLVFPCPDKCRDLYTNSTDLN